MLQPRTSSLPAGALKPWPWLGAVRDLVCLTKPRITTLVLCTTAGGLYLAPGRRPLALTLLTLLGTALVVGGANTLNMYLERDVDALMERTRLRPLPTRRLPPALALGFGLGLGLTGVPVLALCASPLAGLLGALALALYVLVYTPLKRRTWVALIVGAVPGAIPPLLGWTAATGTASLPGLVLFGVLFLWQVPHFVAISLFRQHDYDRAGLHTLPGDRGVPQAKLQALLWVVGLVPVSLALVPLGLAGTGYLVVALGLGVIFFGAALRGFATIEPAAVSRSHGPTTERFGRSLFHVSLIYLTGLFLALLVGQGGA